MYKEARNKARLSMEEAAFRANIGTRTLAKYEAGKTPPPDVALKLAEVYEDPDLIASYCSRECPIGRIFRPEVKTVDIAVATLRLLSELKDVNETIDRLIQIARDGQISSAEISDFERILKELGELHQEIEWMKLLGLKAIKKGAKAA